VDNLDQLELLGQWEHQELVGYLEMLALPGFKELLEGLDQLEIQVHLVCRDPQEHLECLAHLGLKGPRD